MNRLIKVNRFSLLLGQELKVSLLFFLGAHVATPNINSFLPQRFKISVEPFEHCLDL